MVITLNGNPLDIDGIDENVTVLELRNLIEESLKGCAFTLMRVNLDGNIVVAEDVTTLEKLHLADYKNVDLIAESAAEVVLDAFQDGTEILLHLEEVARNVASELRLGKIKDAMEKYLELINGLEWFTTIIREAETVFAAKMAETSFESERQELVEKTKEQISAAEVAQASEDWVGVADIIEYEFCEIFKNGRSLIESLLKA